MYHLGRQVIVRKTITKIDWAKADAVPEDEYDYIDAPEVPAEFFKRMTVLMPDDKKNINIRVRSRTIEYFKKNSKHYQTMINPVLDAYVEAHQKQKLAH